MSRVHCWLARYEAAGYADHWEMEQATGKPEAYCQAICLRREGHAGPHRFTPAAQIIVSFLPLGDEVRR